jgi:TadE-like protein
MANRNTQRELRQRSKLSSKTKLAKRVAPTERNERNERNERGATIVESAIIMGIFFTLLMGLVEGGLRVFGISSVHSAVSEAARQGSTWAASPLADYQILRAVRSNTDSTPLDVTGVIVFKAAGPSTVVPSLCLNELATGGDGVAGVCNVYSGSRLQNFSKENFGAQTASENLWDHQWPTALRQSAISGSNEPDYLGVYMKASQGSLTGVLPKTVLTPQTVMLLEPERANTE